MFFFSSVRLLQHSKVNVELSSAKHSHVDVSLLDSWTKGSHGSYWIGPNSLFWIGSIFGFNSILKRKICAAKLYSSGDGLSPCAWPFSSEIGSEKISPPRIILAVLPVPIAASHLWILSLNPKKEYTFSMKECPTESKAFDWSIATSTPLILFFLQ